MSTTAHSRAAAEFATRHLAGRPDLSKQEELPAELWAAMGEAGLTGCFLPRQYGGGGYGCLQLQQAGEAFVRRGGNLGLATIWFGHSLVARYFIAGFGSAEQMAAWLPAIATGKLTASVAISEPGAGAHPKHLSTRAEQEDGGYRISGEKFYVTNGNMAGLFVVLAITDVVENRKRYSAFLLPGDTAGLEVEAMPPLDYLRPAKHVRLKLSGCLVSKDNLLGPKDEAFEAMARPFRDVEDVLGAGPLLGAMGWQLDALVAELRGNKREHGTTAGKEAVKEAGEEDVAEAAEEALGALDIRLAACRVLAGEAAKFLEEEIIAKQGSGETADGGNTGGNSDGISRLSLAVRAEMREFQTEFKAAREACGSGENPRLEEMTRELAQLVNRPGKVALLKQRKLGAALLNGAG